MLDQLLPTGTVIGVLRGSSAEDAFAHAVAAVEAGLASVEITFTIPGAPDLIRRLRDEYGPRCSIGAGTVLSVEQVSLAVAAGADYLVSPHLDTRLIEAADDTGLPYVPGVITPTELQTAVSAGCSLVKVFPAARLGGPAYLSDLRGPFPDVQFMATGGVSTENAGQYFESGARLVGLGAVFGRTVQETSDRTRQLLDTLVVTGHSAAGK